MALKVLQEVWIVLDVKHSYDHSIKIQWWDPVVEGKKPSIKACRLQGTENGS